MLAPQPGDGAFVLLLSPDHVGTQVPLLAGGLLLDVAPRRWWVPATLCLLLGGPVRGPGGGADRGAAADRRRRGDLGPSAPATFGRAPGGLACWFELALIAAGVISVGAAWAAARLLAAAGGFAGQPFALTLAPLSQLWTHAWLTGWGILELYGGSFIGVTGWSGSRSRRCTSSG